MSYRRAASRRKTVQRDWHLLSSYRPFCRIFRAFEERPNCTFCGIKLCLRMLKDRLAGRGKPARHWLTQRTGLGGCKFRINDSTRNQSFRKRLRRRQGRVHGFNARDRPINGHLAEGRDIVRDEGVILRRHALSGQTRIQRNSVSAVTIVPIGMLLYALLITLRTTG